MIFRSNYHMLRQSLNIKETESTTIVECHCQRITDMLDSIKKKYFGSRKRFSESLSLLLDMSIEKLTDSLLLLHVRIMILKNLCFVNHLSKVFFLENNSQQHNWWNSSKAGLQIWFLSKC